MWIPLLSRVEIHALNETKTKGMGANKTVANLVPLLNDYQGGDATKITTYGTNNKHI